MPDRVASTHRGFCTADPGVAYYSEEVAKRPNLQVVTELLVEKILLEKDGDKDAIAIGILYSAKDGVQSTVFAKQESILAARSIKTPHLLELSGIGNSPLLKSHGIETVIDNPNVGENLQEHGFVPFSWEAAEGLTAEALRNPEIGAATMAAWQQSGAGPLGLCPLPSAFMPLPELQDGELNTLFDEYLKPSRRSSKHKNYSVECSWTIDHGTIPDAPPKKDLALKESSE